MYDHFIRPDASQAERTWVGRGIIAVATVVALVLVLVGRYSANNPLGMIVILGLLAIAFATQLLPVTLDMLFIRQGTRAGAIWGMVTGLMVVFALSPFFFMFVGNFMDDTLRAMKRLFDVGAWGLVGNALVFALISAIQRRGASLA